MIYHSKFIPVLNPIFILWLSTFAIANAGPLLIRETEALTPEEELQKFTVAPGFEVRLFAAEPMINKPINIAWDKCGRLWVSSTVEYPYAAPRERWSDESGTRVEGSRDAIKILEDTDGDGRADTVRNFADSLNIPTGVLPWHRPEHHEGCLAWSIPNIWYFADTTGDGRADHREVLFGPLGWEKDTHGMLSSFRLGPDGWVYATHGFNNTSHFKAGDGSTLDLHSGNVLRFRPDGSAVEAWSRGQVNPFGLCFDGRGNLYSADCHSAPIYQLLRGAVYPSFGKPHDGLGFGPAMIEHSHGSTGIAGIVYLDRNRWGADWNDHILIGNPVLSRINRDHITFTGSTPVAEEKEDFLVSDDPWFRPVDLCLGGDGALYVADFYNRIIGHYEVPLDHPGRDRERGRIWRITKKEDVQKSVPPVTSPKTPTLADLKNQSPHLRRAAASHFQFAPQLEALPILLEVLAGTSRKDTHLHHTLRMAIRANLQVDGAFSLPEVDRCDLDLILASKSRDAADYLFTKWKNGPVLREEKFTQILNHLGQNGEGELLEKVIQFEKNRKPLNQFSQVKSLTALTEGLAKSGRAELNALFLPWAADLAPRVLRLADSSLWKQGAGGSKNPPWVTQKRTTSGGKTITVISSLPAHRPDAESLTGTLRSAPFRSADDGEVSFWICGHCGPLENASHGKNRVRLLDSKTGRVLREVPAPRSDVCQRITWKVDQNWPEKVCLEIIDEDDGGAFAWLGFSGISPKILHAGNFQQSKEIETGLRALADLLKYSAPVGLRDRLRDYLPPSPAPPPSPVSKEEKARIDQLIRSRIAAHPQAQIEAGKGKEIFKIHCASCHQIAGEGQLIGPQLDGIGQRGLARLCEDILDPNRNVDAHFRLTILDLKEKRSLAGFIESENEQTITMRDAAGHRFTTAKSHIKEQKTTSISLMPAIFGSAIPEKDFHNLLSWLLAQ